MIDTGFDFKGKWSIQPKLCATGHKDFTNTDLQDKHGHGTHIAGLIAKNAGDVDYCLVIIKFYDPKEFWADNLANMVKAINYAIVQKVDVINISGGGMQYDAREHLAVLRALDARITIVAAAGNESKELTKRPFYPALYDSRIVVVGAVDKNLKRIPAANHGKQVDVEELGKDVLSTLPNNTYGYMTGTSQATAIHTGKIVNGLYKIKKLDSKKSAKPLKTLKTKSAR